MELIDKKCKPCDSGMPAMTLGEITTLIKQTPEWSLDENRIERTFKFNNFKLAIEFINKVALIAEEEGHHPDINLYGYKNVKIILTTHAINGLSENDFILAAKIDMLVE